MASPASVVKPVSTVEIIKHYVESDGLNPNCSILGKPLLIYKKALDLSGVADGAGMIERLFHSNGFPPHWRSGMFPESHYHSTSHEVLAVFQGKVTCQFGGPLNGVEEVVEVGDVVIIPAGLAHRSLADDGGPASSSSSSCLMVGAYPLGCEWDMCYGVSHDECNAKRAAIIKVKPLRRDPVWGGDGPALHLWK